MGFTHVTTPLSSYCAGFWGLRFKKAASESSADTGLAPGRCSNFIVLRLWKQLDVNSSGFITLESWDATAYKSLMQFRTTLAVISKLNLQPVTSLPQVTPSRLRKP